MKIKASGHVRSEAYFYLFLSKIEVNLCTEIDNQKCYVKPEQGKYKVRKTSVHNWEGRAGIYHVRIQMRKQLEADGYNDSTR